MWSRIVYVFIAILYSLRATVERTEISTKHYNKKRVEYRAEKHFTRHVITVRILGFYSITSYKRLLRAVFVLRQINGIYFYSLHILRTDVQQLRIIYRIFSRVLHNIQRFSSDPLVHQWYYCHNNIVFVTIGFFFFFSRAFDTDFFFRESVEKYLFSLHSFTLTRVCITRIQAVRSFFKNTHTHIKAERHF